MASDSSVWRHLAQLYAPTLATPGDVARLIDPRTVQTPALDLIDMELVRLADTPDSRLIISMPPQEGKSTRVGRDLPVWLLQRSPDTRIIMGSYGQSLAMRNGRAIRNAIATHPELGVSIADDHGSASEWSIAGHRGGVYSIGRGGGVTGRPADLLIIDDPIKDRAEAESTTIRDTCWDWWTDALAARLAPGAQVVLIMTRWHQDDLAGRLMERDAAAGWRLLNIPAQCDTDDDPLGRQPGEYLVSARGRTRAQWESRKATAGARTWSALYQGRPAPAQGGILLRHWWKRWTVLPRMDRIFQSWDLTFTGAKGSDYVVGQVWGQHGHHLYLLHQTRGRWGFSEQLAEIRRTREAWPQTVAILIEAAANGHAAIDTLRAGVPGIIGVTPRGGKTVRAEAVAPLIEAGNVHVPTLGPWADSLIEECAAFPHDTHDDQVDAMTQAVSWALLPNLGERKGSSFFDIG